jgi:transcriptional regulator with XRE-family HTH domain
MTFTMSMGKRRTPLAQFLVKERYRRGLSQEELAQRSGLSVATIANVEAGRSARVAPKTLHSIGAALGIDTGDLFDLMEQGIEAGDDA